MSHEGQTVNTEGGTSVGNDVAAGRDFAGRDVIGVQNIWIQQATANLERTTESVERSQDRLQSAAQLWFWLTIIQFALGVILFISAILSAFLGLSALQSAVLGGLGVLTLLAFFLARPLGTYNEALSSARQENAIYAVFIARISSTQDPKLLAEALQDFNQQINDLIQEREHREARRSMNTRPGLK